MREVVLINANTLKPPVSPVGLEYVAESLTGAGFPLRIIDLAFADDWKADIGNGLRGVDPLFVGVSVRNTDDCSYISGQSFLPWISEVVAEVRKHTAAPVFLGGVGFSVMPDVVVRATGADGGIAGDGEDAVVALARALSENRSIELLPNLVFRRGREIVCNDRKFTDLARLPARTRSLFDNRRYQELGAQVGVETKRGCGMRCYYCADPVAKGSNVRLRPPHLVAQEFVNLVRQGITWFHMCDHEFNLPISHAREVCRALISERLGEKIRWYTYCAPEPFDRELLVLMRESGCAGINFGVDSLCDEQLRRLGRNYTAEHVRELTVLLNHERMNYFYDLLVGGPGETPETVRITIERAKEYGVAGAGIAVGVRVYQGTRLGGDVAAGLITDGLHPAGKRDAGKPLFYVSPELGNAGELVRRLVGRDDRFMVLAEPGEEGSYNYARADAAGDDLLSRLIREGARGAYWDILRRHRYGHPAPPI